MKTMKPYFVVAFVMLAGLVLGGCALDRSEVKLAAPGAEASQASGGRVVVIRSVKDERVFQQAPSEPSTPSLGGEGADKASPEIKARAIARKRNGYGQALGDVLLEPGKTVEGAIRENLTAALRKAGYDVRESAAAAAKPIYIDVRIRRLWAWLTPGFMTVTLRANIETDLTISGGNPPVNVSVSTEHSTMAAGDSAWIEVMQKALQTYREQATSKTAALK